MIDLPQAFGKYTLVERIAIGGMAEIFKATAPGLGDFEKLLAIKRLHPRYSEDQDFIHMLVDEAKIAVQLTHSNIGQIFDLGREEELIFIAMEFIDGRDLYRVLKRLGESGRLLPFEVAVYIIMEVCAGLDYAHRKNAADGTPLSIIHRDISPQNVLVSWEGEVKLIDFGIAKAALRAFETESGVIKGKFYYMSPEQARGDSLDHRSDIFSLGICLYELLTGQTVYAEEDDITLLSRVRRAEISPPTTMRADIPHDLERICMKALSRNPKRRYQNAHQLQMALSSFLFSMGQPFSKVQLGSYMRELFDRDQVYPTVDVPIAYHDRFMSRVDYTADGSFLRSELMSQEITAIVPEKQRITNESPPVHDPYAEVSLDFDGGDDFEAAPTRAEVMDHFGDEEHTWVYPGAVEMEVEDTSAVPRPAGPPPLPPPIPSMGGDDDPPTIDLPAQMPPPEPAPSASKVPNARRPSIAIVPDVHTGIVTGVFSEPTRITDLDSLDLEDEEGGPPKPVAAAISELTGQHDLTDVPLLHKLIFGAGLALILMVAGAISAVSAVVIGDSAEASNDPVVIAPITSNGEGDEAGIDAEPEAQEAAVPDTRTLVVTVKGPTDAKVILGDDEKASPATFEGLELDETYDLKVTADNWRTHTETLTIEEAMPSGHSVEMSPRLGTLIVNTEPSGGAILIDGKAQERKTPANIGELDRTKEHTVKLQLADHTPHEVKIAWTDDDDDVKTLEYSFEAIEKEPPVAENPPAAVAETKPRVDKAPRESRADRLARERERRDKERRDRERRERDRRDRANKGSATSNSGGAREFGILSVNSRPWGHVYVDGKRVANETPVMGLRLTTGYHTVKVVFPTLDGVVRSKTVVIKKDAPSSVFFKP